MSSFLRKFKHKEDSINRNKEENMKINGEIVLKELIASSNGKYNPYRIFSAKELKLATDDYHLGRLIIHGVECKLYKGFWQDRLISVMKFENCKDWGEYSAYGSCINNIVYASQMIHKHILQLIGCCLETEIPILVFEYVEDGTLADRISVNTQFEPLQLTQRLKIAMDMANALAYLHLGFPRPIVFRNFRMPNILFNEENIAKLFDFSFSIAIPEGETHITDEVIGTYRFIAPEYMSTGAFNEISDVYGFGLFLLELFTGQKVPHILDGGFSGSDPDDVTISLQDRVKKYIEENRVNEIVDPLITEDRSSPRIEQLLQLIFECVNESPVDRPAMDDVAKRLRQMYRS